MRSREEPAVHRPPAPFPLALAALAAGALALPAGSAAKELAGLAVCGTNGCHRITGERALRGFENGGFETAPPARARAYYEVRARVKDDTGHVLPAFTVLYLRRSGLIRAEGDLGRHVWTQPAPATATALKRAARGLRPHPASGLGSVREPEPVARVDEVFAPAADAAGGGDGGPVAASVAGAGALVLLAGGAGLIARRRRRAK
jgi:LPXTG-motif cell wall-anchored protein